MLTYKQIQLKIRQEKEKLSQVDKKKAQTRNISDMMKRRIELEARSIQQHIKRLETQLKSAKKF